MKIVQLSDGRWLASYYLGSKQRRIKRDNKKQLEQFANKEQFEYIQKGITPESYKSSISFQEACEKYMTLYAIPNGQKEDQCHIDKTFLPFLGPSTRLTAITVERLKELKAHMLTKMSPASFNRRWTLMRGIFREAINSGYITSDPSRLVKKVKGADCQRFRYFTSEEIRQLFDTLEPKPKLFATVALYTGFRLENLQRLEWAHIDTHRNVVHATKTKSGKAYYVPMNLDLINALQALKSYSKGPYVLPRGNWGRIFRNVFIKMGWWSPKMPVGEKASVHTFRHTFASHLAMKGVPLDEIAGYMGHSTLAMTKRYRHLSPTHLQAGINLLNFGFKTEGDKLLEEAKNA